MNAFHLTNQKEGDSSYILEILVIKEQYQLEKEIQELSFKSEYSTPFSSSLIGFPICIATKKTNPFRRTFIKNNR